MHVKPSPAWNKFEIETFAGIRQIRRYLPSVSLKFCKLTVSEDNAAPNRAEAKLIPFNPYDPFPLTSVPISGEAAQFHASGADAWLGLRVEETEGRLFARDAGRTFRSEGHEIWAEKGSAVFLTPYIELRLILAAAGFPETGFAVDLGAGYGRMGFVVGACFPRASWRGYELVAERAHEGARALAAHPFAARCESHHADVSHASFEMPEADLYFIYDFGSLEAVRSAVEKIKAVASRRSVTVVGRGRLSRDHIERNQPWLSQVAKPTHFPTFSVYRSAH